MVACDGRGGAVNGRGKKRMLSDLWIWDREVLGELERRIKNSRRELERCRRRGINQEQVNREHILRYKLERL